MNPHSFDAINPLIANLQEQGRTVHVTFQCPITQKQVSARHYASKDTSMSSRMQDTVSRSAMYSIQNAIGRAIRDIFGYNMFGRIASDLARQTVNHTSNNVRNSLSQKEKEQAILQAFQSVSKQFAWDNKNMRWIAANAIQDVLSGFDLQRQQHPVSHPYDLQILARMLVEVAMADGILAPEEKEWLTSLLDPRLGTIDSIARNPKLTAAELSQTSVGGVRETMLMVAWTLALCDEDFAEEERALLMEFVTGLQLSSQQVGTIQYNAQSYILEQAMEYMYSNNGGDAFARQSILQMATKLGMTQRQALEIEAKTQRRRAQF